MDARLGLTPQDEVFALQARQSGKPVTVIANKCEGRVGGEGFYEAYRLGLGEPLAISAEHNEGIGVLLGLLEEAHEKWLEDGGGDGGEGGEDRPLKVAIAGRPNAGKSTLVNRFLGQQRMITGPEAGLTRDSISVDFNWGEKKLRLFDTAGLRRKSKIKFREEKISASDALRAIGFAEIVIFLVDAERPLEKQDLTLCDLVAEEGRALVIAINKWDLVKDKQKTLKHLRLEVERLLPQIKGVPVVPISALQGRSIDKLMTAVFAVNKSWNVRINTSKLNSFLQDATGRHTPPAIGGRRIKLRYMTQPNTRPPTFIVFCSKPEDLPTSYQRYLINSLREDFNLWGVPIRMTMRRGRNPYVKG